MKASVHEHANAGVARRLLNAIQAGEVKIIDLSILAGPEYPCTWPGSAPFQSYPIRRYNDPADPDYIRMVISDEHFGTHMDAPAHYVPAPETGLPFASPAGRLTSDRIELDQLIGPAVVIDVGRLSGTGAPGLSPEITSHDIVEWEATNGPLEANDIVLFRSGWSERYASGEEGRAYGWNAVVLKSEPGWPGLNQEAMKLLVDRRVTVVGTEGGGPGVLQDDARIHQIGLSAGIVFVERLAHLDALPTRGAIFCFLPVRWAHGSGAPGRAIALVDSVP